MHCREKGEDFALEPFGGRNDTEERKRPNCYLAGHLGSTKLNVTQLGLSLNKMEGFAPKSKQTLLRFIPKYFHFFPKISNNLARRRGDSLRTD